MPVGYLKGSNDQQGDVQTYQRRPRGSEEFEMPSTLKAQLVYHKLSFVEYLVRKKCVRALHNALAKSRSGIRISNQMIVEVFRALDW